MRLRNEAAGARRALGVLGALVALGISTLAAPAGAAPDSTAPAKAVASPTKTTPKSTPPAVRPPYPQLVFDKAQYESLLSVNDHCPVRGGRLNPGIRPMYVNRQPVGFC